MRPKDDSSVANDKANGFRDCERSALKPVDRESFGLVQVLRGIAASWVVLFHASEGHHIDRLKESIPTWTHPIFDVGNNGVAIFFALSGFVIAHSLRNDHISFGYLGRFALRRSIRLDPALWASIALFIGFAALSSFVKSESFAAPSTAVILSNATYTQLFLGVPSINPVYWTLCYEVQFYLVLVLCVMAAQRFGRLVYLVPFAVAVAWGCGVLEQPVAGLFVDRWHCFYLGALAYWAVKSDRALVGFALLLVALAAARPDLFTVICMLTAAGLLVAGKTGFIRNGLAWRPLLFLGTVSYSLYLTHNPVAGAAFFLLEKAGVPQWASLVISCAACVTAAAAFWFVIERPTMRLAHRVKLPRSREVVSGFASDAEITPQNA